MSRFVKIPVVFTKGDETYDINDRNTYYIETDFSLDVDKVEKFYHCEKEMLTNIDLDSGDNCWTFYSVDQLMSLFNGEETEIDKIFKEWDERE